jgi:hypothetical protein
MSEQSELAELTEAVEGVAVDLAANASSLAALKASVDEQNCRLGQLAPRSSLRNVAAVLALCGILVASLLGVVVYLNHETTCGVREVLQLAQSSSAERNPISPSLSPEELQRAQQGRERAQEFYARALDELKVLWPCDGGIEWNRILGPIAIAIAIVGAAGILWRYRERLLLPRYPVE